MLKKLIRVLLHLDGRITRKQFWLAWILILILGLGINLAASLLGKTFFFITYIYLTITIYGKRLHDFTRSAWILVWPFGIHAAVLATQGLLLRAAFSEERFSGGDLGTLILVTLLGFVPYLSWFITALFVGIPSGAKEDNRFGPDPRVEETPASRLKPSSPVPPTAIHYPHPNYARQ